MCLALKDLLSASHDGKFSWSAQVTGVKGGHEIFRASSWYKLRFIRAIQKHSASISDQHESAAPTAKSQWHRTTPTMSCSWFIGRQLIEHCCCDIRTKSAHSQWLTFC